MKRKIVLLIALAFVLTSCGGKKEKLKEVELKTKKLETVKETKNAPLLKNFKVTKKDKMEIIIADVKNDKNKKKTLKILETLKIPYKKGKETVEFLKSEWDLKYKKEVVEKLEKEFEIAKKSETKAEKKTDKKSEKKVETKSENITGNTSKTLRKTKEETVKEKNSETKKERVWVVDVKKQDPVYENKCVITKEAWTETTDELISADRIIKPRWFVKTNLGTEYFYSSKEALDRHVELGNKGHLGNWGTAEDEVIITNKKYKTINHPEEKSCKKVVVKEGVKEKGHWEYR